MDGSDEPKVPDGPMRPRGLISPISPISPIGLMSLPGTPWKIKKRGRYPADGHGDRRSHERLHN